MSPTDCKSAVYTVAVRLRPFPPNTKGVMKNIFKFMLVAILGIFGYYLIQPYAPLVVGMISLFFAWQLFQSTLPEMEDWRLRIMQAELDSLKRWADRI